MRRGWIPFASVACSVVVAWAAAPGRRWPGAPKGVASAPAPRPTAPGRWLDAVPGHRLTGVSRDDAPENSDLPDLLRVSRDGAFLGRYRDARFVPGRADALLVIDEENRLLRIDGGHRREVLDHDAQPGFDVSAACGCVVFVRGQGNGSQIVRVGVGGGAPDVIASEQGAAWLPVVSPAGDEVAFLSDRTGFGSWWIVSLKGGAPRQITNLNARSISDLAPAPEGPDRPVWAGSWLVFEHDGVTHAVSVSDGKAAWSRAGLGAPRWQERDRQLSFGEGRPLPVDQALREAVR